MTKSEYRAYIRSEDWQNRRRKFLIANDECARCKLPRWVARLIYDQELHIHHRTYEHLGHETYADIEALCRRCHEVETFGHSNLTKVPSCPCPDCPVDGRIFDPYTERCASCLADEGEILSYLHGISWGAEKAVKV